MTKQNRPTPPSSKKIAEYWYDQLPKKHNENLFYCNNLWLAEPACQGCGGWSSDSPNPSSWDHHALEKAHIIAWSIGGSNEPSNFLLLCRHCHLDFDNEVSITDMKDFIEVSRWLSERPKSKGDKVQRIYDDYVSKNNLNEKRFFKAFAQAKRKVYMGPEKSLEEYLHKIFVLASTVYPFITEEHAKMNIFKFLKMLEDQEIEAQNNIEQEQEEDWFIKRAKKLLKISIETKCNTGIEIIKKSIEEKGYDYTQTLFECYEEMGLTLSEQPVE